MRKLTVMALASAAAVATPASARDGSPYLGFEGGVMFARDTNVDLALEDSDPDGVSLLGDFDVEYKAGVDFDAIAGYDFGMIRAEAEVAYKSARHDEYNVFITDGVDSEEGSADGDGKTKVLSLMGNLLLDFGNPEALSFYAGGGAGWARVKFKLEDPVLGSEATERGFAWQGIAGVRYAISPNIDLGLKYRYFRGPRFNDSDTIDTITSSAESNHFRSHSLLAGLTFNFGGQEAAPPPPPPEPAPVVAAPPAPAPSTQTCPDGSVVLATDSCPVPPPPPPPPAPAAERG